MGRHLVAAVLVCGAFLSWPAWAQDIGGSYTIEGNNPGTTTVYKGVVSIAKQGEVYVVEWRIGNQVQRGTGILRDDILSVVYSAEGSEPGIAAYKLRPDGGLDGQWVPQSGRKVATENWRPRNRT